MRTPGADPERFVRAWQAGATVAAVALELGMRARTVQERARRYREMGIPLKMLYAGKRGPCVDVPRLSTLVAGLNKEPSR